MFGGAYGGGVVALVGVVGSRSAAPAGVAPCVRALVAAGHSVVTGCAGGVDAAARAAAPGCSVVSAAGPARWQLAARTRALVAQLAASPGARLVAWPSGACPAVCVPGGGSGGGSGTWLAVALAVAAGVPVVVWLPSGVAAPAWPGGAWAPAAASGPWSAAVAWVPAAAQLALV